jgi:hypothetical protein
MARRIPSFGQPLLGSITIVVCAPSHLPLATSLCPITPSVFRQRWRAARRANAIADLERHFNPPPPVSEPEVIYVEAEQGTGRLGYSDFDVRLMAQPLRWW